MTHVRTSPNYPQSNGKIERWHGTLKTECIRPGTPLSLDDARRIVGQWVEHYNTVRLHSAIDYIAPKDKLEGRAQSILAARDVKLAAAREKRRIKRQQAAKNVLTDDTHRVILQTAGETEASSAGEQLAATSGRRDTVGLRRTSVMGSCCKRLPHPIPQRRCPELPHASSNSDLPQASRSLTREAELSNSR